MILVRSDSIIALLFFVVLLVGNFSTFFFNVDDVFVADFYAKRVSFLLAFVVFLSWVAVCFYRGKVGFLLKKEIVGFLFLVSFFFFVLGVVNHNPFKFIVTDLSQIFFSLIVFFLISKTNMKDDFNIFFMVLFACFVAAVLGHKMQFSYASLLGSLFVFWFFFKKSVFFSVFVFFVSGYVFYNSLLGKSAVLGLLFLLLFVFLAVSSVNKRSAVIFGFVFFVLIPVFLYPMLDFFSDTKSYKNFVFFISNLDMDGFTFDQSTGNRIYEAVMVIDSVSSSYSSILFGNGLGSYIDMSGTPDDTVIRVQEDPTMTRNVHLELFYILLRFGVVGVLFFYMFLFFLLKRSFEAISLLVLRSEAYAFKFKWMICFCGCYVFFIVWDGQVSAGHMLTNSFFWFCVAILIKYNNIIVSSRSKRFFCV